MDLFNCSRHLFCSLIVALILLFPKTVFAGAAEKWDYKVKPDQSKNIVLIEAKKVNIPVANDSTYKVRVSPSKSVVARTMMRRLFKRANPLIGASTIAVEALLSSYGYKIDDEKQVIYKEISDGQSLYHWQCYGKFYTNINSLASCHVEQANIISHGTWEYRNPNPSISENGKDVSIYADRHDFKSGSLLAQNLLLHTERGQLNPNPNPNPETKTLTELELGDIMFGLNPDTGADTGVWTGVKEAYERIPNEKPSSDEAPYFIEQLLENTNPDSNSTDITHTDPDTGKTSTSSLPDFCTWATAVCDFFQWFKDDSEVPEPEEYKITEFDNSKLPVGPQFSFTSQCPVSKTFTLNLGMISTEIAMPYDSLCKFAIDVRPFVILAAWLHACYIFVGFVRS